ncbi:hypothetical protein BJ878DRAFT_541853 [Calycina marina]|uniref:Uncharacterized protein n=1 Tax=Calycina marina TaxID=1763456 RepID=A0A9P7Z4P7_9HELO|nr:hypothetical protein BJ878DRAFT_541853 [Calycina marina]
MVIVNGHSTSAAPNHHRQNRCRERPGSRTRRNKSRKSDLQSAIHDGIQEGIVDAHNSGVYLPSDRYVSPMLRQTFDQSWARWKLREAEEKEALALIEAAEQAEKLAMEREQIKLFGGDVGDDVSLCEPMLRVMSYLFGGIDYTDP